MQDFQHSGNQEALVGRQRRKYVILFIVKDGLGILLLILGGLAVKNTQGQTDTFGPPYFIGAFIVGCALTLAGLIDGFLYRSLYNKDEISSSTLKDLAQYTCGEVGLTAVSVLGGFIGIFFVALFGVQECDPDDFFSHCNYTKNISENRSIAIAILIFLLVNEIVAIGSIVVHCRVCRGLGPYNAFRPRGHAGLMVQHQTYTAGGAPANVIITTAPEPPSYHAGRHGYRRDYDDFSGDRQIIVDGQVIDKNRGGFQGAILSQPQNATVIHPPTGYPQYSAQPGQNAPAGYGAQGYQASGTVNELQEQNRLLREQLALQQQQLHIMQQQQQDGRAPSPSHQQVDTGPPPPSYESCFQDQAHMNLLQEQNRELRNRYESQQQRLEKMAPPEPSAPSM